VGFSAVSIPSLWFFQPSQELAMSQFAFSVIPVEAGSPRVCWRLAFVGMTKSEVKPLTTDLAPYQNCQPVETTGKPLSEIILGERR